MFRNLIKKIVPPPTTNTTKKEEEIKNTTSFDDWAKNRLNKHQDNGMIKSQEHSQPSTPSFQNYSSFKEDGLGSLDDFSLEDELPSKEEQDGIATIKNMSFPLSPLGKVVQEALDRWGFIGKTPLNANIFFEDSKSNKEESIFYFTYNEEISPADYYNCCLKPNSKMSRNIEAAIIADAVGFFNAGVGAVNIGKIVVINGRV